MRRVSNTERRISALLVAGGASALLCLYLAPPQAYGIPPCPFYYFTGLFCPGCGSLRSIHNLLQGDLARAFGFNPLLVLLVPYFVFMGINEVSSLLRKTKWEVDSSPRAGWVLFSVILAFWVTRNLPWRIFEVLRPGL
jgi:hypothetical protein